METIINLILFIFILGILVFIHELGHFLTAKKSGVYIHEFSIGMGPLIKTIKGKDGIDYSIRALPIGGYVQMAGEIYEDDDTNEIPKDKFMCNKPWYQRLIILVAGVFNNFLLAIILLFVIALIWGAPSLKPVINGVEEGYPSELAGIKAGDVITEINGSKVKTWDKAQLLLILQNKNNDYEVEITHEDGKTEKKKIDSEGQIELKKGDVIKSITNKKTKESTNMYLVTSADGKITLTHQDKVAEEYEYVLKKNDEKQEQEQQEETAKNDATEKEESAKSDKASAKKQKDNEEKDEEEKTEEEKNAKEAITYDEIPLIAGDTITDYTQEKVYLVIKDTYEISVKHQDGTTEKTSVSPKIGVTEDGTKTKTFGIQLKSDIDKGFMPSLKYAFQKFASLIEQMWLTIVNLFTGGLSINNLSGPVGIYSVVGESRSAGIENVIFLIAYLSVNLGIMNILPIPALDGGHVMFLIIELITRKKVNEKVESITTTIFFILLLALMLYITIHDIIRLIF